MATFQHLYISSIMWRLSRTEKVTKSLTETEHCYEMKNYISCLIDHAHIIIFCFESNWKKWNDERSKVCNLIQYLFLNYPGILSVDNWCFSPHFYMICCAVLNHNVTFFIVNAEENVFCCRKCSRSGFIKYEIWVIPHIKSHRFVKKNTHTEVWIYFSYYLYLFLSDLSFYLSLAI